MSRATARQPSVFTPSTLAERWACSERKVRLMIDNGDLIGFLLGPKLWRINATEVEEYEATRALPLPPKPASVYIIRAGDYVKIGKAGNVAKRLASLRTSSPVELTLLHTISDHDGHALEKTLHSQFAHLRAQGEWFHYKGDLSAWVDEGCPV
ncbi:MAG: GIY-YIG nuclease family protein [Rhizobiaceae bacterium]|nr:GIY-YIG nuclease family protein [Rhizobiaceae bacterium]